MILRKMAGKVYHIELSSLSTTGGLRTVLPIAKEFQGGLMKKSPVLFLLGLFILNLSPGADSKTGEIKKVGNPAPAGAPVKEIEISAKKYEFTPAQIEVPVNTLVKLHLKATDKEHGFELKSVKNSCVKYKPEEPATLE